MPVPISLTVNGKTVAANIDPRTLLVDFLRNDLALTGTHVGCDTGQCGACTVHLNGRAVKACTILALQAQGANVLTIEGLAAADGTLHPMQAAFKECHGLQCGFCTPGMSRRRLTSTPAVGSSRKRICGSCDSALAMSRRRFMWNAIFFISLAPIDGPPRQTRSARGRHPSRRPALPFDKERQ